MTGAIARLLSRFGGGRRLTDLFEDRPLTGPLWAVGDIHGCFDLYLEIEDRIAAEAAATSEVQTIAVLGDMIDRGPEVKGVLDHLSAPPPEGLARWCLMGNHEDMLLRFLARPEANRAWLSFGAAATLASYGITPAEAEAKGLRWTATALEVAMGQDTLAFLEALPAGITAGPFVLAHAGTGPETPLARQTRHDLLWARHGDIPDLLPPSDLGGRTVVHGHVPVEAPVLNDWRINVDTGAFATGRLSAVRLVPGAPPRFMTTGIA